MFIRTVRRWTFGRQLPCAAKAALRYVAQGQDIWLRLTLSCSGSYDGTGLMSSLSEITTEELSLEYQQYRYNDIWLVLCVILIEFSYSVLPRFHAIHAVDLIASLCIFLHLLQLQHFNSQHSTSIFSLTRSHSFFIAKAANSLEKLHCTRDDDDVHRKGLIDSCQRLVSLQSSAMIDFYHIVQSRSSQIKSKSAKK